MGPLRDLGADQGKSYDHEVSTLLGDTLAGLYCIEVDHCTTVVCSGRLMRDCYSEREEERGTLRREGAYVSR